MDYHKKMSYIKSGVRILGYVFLMVGGVALGAILLLGAEVVGILEERYE